MIQGKYSKGLIETGKIEKILEISETSHYPESDFLVLHHKQENLIQIHFYLSNQRF